jgi:hypothetical protein
VGSSGTKRGGRRHLEKVHDTGRPAITFSGTLRSWFLRSPERELAPLPLPAEPIAPSPWYEYRWLGYVLATLGIAVAGRQVVKRRRSTRAGSAYRRSR